tara:strand:- start:3769 stop:4119 length:351 start_codon:yes stop_codon:yes gene_type:complete
MKNTVIIILFFLSFSCKSTSEINSQTITCQLIEKEFTHKGGEFTETKELYLRCSTQDYFIKVCESNITAEQLKPYLNKTIKVDMEIKKGLLDHCETIPEYAQSRSGTYVVLKKIIK